MGKALDELHRVLKPSGRFVIIIGRESTVRKTTFKNGDLLLRLATECARFDLVLQQFRVFRNRFSQDIYEDIFLFVPSQKEPKTTPYAVARDVLSDALQRCLKEVVSDLESAIASIDSMQPSPLLEM